MNDLFSKYNYLDYAKCNFCPRKCNVNRLNNQLGYCKSDISFNIGSVCIHKGEEPVLGGEKGICNVFFTHCNLSCIYCQNYQISNNKNCLIEYKLSFEEIIKKIEHILDKGIKYVGFVSPSHYALHIKAIVKELRSRGREFITIYNSNAYDDIQTLKDLSELIDIYLPDFKYMDSNLSFELSDCKDYPEIAIKAIKEMYNQKGSTLIKNEQGYAENGLIIRHLILPGQIQNTLDVLRTISYELSEFVHISLMSQYYPTENTTEHKYLKNKISLDEYNIALAEMENLGFHRGWIQDIESSKHYFPDFKKSHPFES